MDVPHHNSQRADIQTVYPMNSIDYLTLPCAEQLRSKSGWQRNPLDPDIYSTVRCHLTIRTGQLSSEIHFGNIVDSFSATAGVSEEITRNIEFDQEFGLVRESLEQFVWENLLLDEFSSELGLHFNAPQFASLCMTNKVSATRHFKQSLTRSDKIQMTRTQRRKITTIRKYTTQASDPARDTQFVVAEPHVRYAADVRFIYIDHLTVKHSKSLFGKRYTTSKAPEVIDGKHPNIVKIGAPLFRVLFWKPLDALMTLPKAKYRNGVGNPLDLEIVPIPEGSAPYAPISPSPTLYQLASEAFPARPSNR